MLPSQLLFGAWTQAGLAVNSSGEPVDPWGSSAVKFDIMGALMRTGQDTPENRLVIAQKVSDLQHFPSELLPYGRITVWNSGEGRTMFEVISLLQSVKL